MTYVRAVEAAGGIPVVVPPVGDRTLGACSDGSTGSCSREVRTSHPGRMARSLMSSWARPSLTLIASSMRWRERPCGSGCRPWASVAVLKRSMSSAAAACTSTCRTWSATRSPIASQQTAACRLTRCRRPGKHAGRCAWNDGAERQLVSSPGCRPPGRRSVRVRVGAGRNHRGDRGPSRSLSSWRFSGTRRLCATFPCIWRCSKSWPASQLESQRCDGLLSARVGVQLTMSALSAPMFSDLRSLVAMVGAALSTDACREDVMGASLGHRAMPAQAQWAEWNTEVAPYGVGIEEEVMLVDPARRWALAQRIDDVLHEAAPGAGRPCQRRDASGRDRAQDRSPRIGGPGGRATTRAAYRAG